MSSSRPSGEVERYHLELPTDLGQVGAAVESVAACCFAQVQPTPRTWFRLCTVMAEVLANAMENGNLNNPTLKVLVEVTVHPDRIVIGVSDEGEGFDPVSVPPLHQQPLESTTGRGLFMIRHLSDDVSFNAQGNTIWVTLPRS